MRQLFFETKLRNNYLDRKYNASAARDKEVVARMNTLWRRLAIRHWRLHSNGTNGIRDTFYKDFIKYKTNSTKSLILNDVIIWNVMIVINFMMWSNSKLKSWLIKFDYCEFTGQKTMRVIHAVDFDDERYNCQYLLLNTVNSIFGFWKSQ